MRDAQQVEAAFSAITKERAGAVIVQTVIAAWRTAEIALRHRVPSVYLQGQFAESGGLMSVGADLADMHRRIATYVDKILKGAKPGDLPVEQPTKFELVINLKTGKALGLTSPPSLLLREKAVHIGQRKRLMGRRDFIMSVADVLVAVPLVVEAQQPAKAPRIGLLSEFSPADSALWYEAFRQGLRNLGWVEGKNINIDYRYTEGRHDRLPGLAAELVSLRVDIIVTATTPVALAAKNATRTIPIVMASVGVDPVGAGLVESLARPGGNITGLSQMVPELVGKRLELLKEMDPKLSSVAVLWGPQDTSATLWKEMQLPARALGVQLHSLEVRSPKDLDRAFEDATRARAGAVVIMPTLVSATNLKRIADLAAKSRLPSIYHRREFADSGGLIAYGVDRSDMFRRAATYVDKILKGAKPADLPVEQPTKFELVINLKTAQALGLTIPPSLLLRADQVIE